MTKFNWMLVIMAIILLAITRLLFHFMFRGTKDWWNWKERIMDRRERKLKDRWSLR